MDKIKTKLSLQDFDISHTIGSGTFSQVKLAKLKTNSSVPPLAIKTIQKSFLASHQETHHISSELQILNLVKNRFIVKFYCTFEDSQNIYIVFKYIQGGNMMTLFKEFCRFNSDIIKFYSTQVFFALSYLHKDGIIYRDLKIENILVTKKGYLKLTDFGFAKKLDGKTYTLCGTPDYLAPEVIMRANGYSLSADWWSFGVFLYEMAEGCSPFHDENPINIYKNIISGKFEFFELNDSSLKSLIKGLLTPEKHRKTETEIFNHKFFKNFNWHLVYTHQFPAPWVPDSRAGFFDCQELRGANTQDTDLIEEF